MTIEGISSISLATADDQAFARTVAFYVQFGFRVVKTFAKNGPVVDHIGVSNDSIRETWLELFPVLEERDGAVVPAQELGIYAGDGSEGYSRPVLIKVRLSAGATAGGASGAAGASSGTTGTASGASGRDIYFFTTSLDKCRAIAAAAGGANSSASGANSSASEASASGAGASGDPGASTSTASGAATDPLGNTLHFITQENHISSPHFTSPTHLIDHKNQARPHAPPRSPTSTKKKIAVMTSGGDSPGMNPAVRAVVRAAIYHDCDAFAVYEGYEGLVHDYIKPMAWGDVRAYLASGGTNIGTARSKRFRERAGRVEAAANMIKNGIDALIVCGGDGSLTGADLFRREWPSLVQELVDTGRYTAPAVAPYRHLTIAGLVGSIDNDMATTDATIGAYSSLERISEMVDYIDATATSHSRAFVVEVMGRHCGWLGLMAGMATGADFIFIPERPPAAGSWHEELKRAVKRHRAYGKRNTTVIVAEGAIDDQLNPITSSEVKEVLVDLGLDTRITTLGHVQRGGSAVAYDRMLGTVQGVEAVRAVLEMTPDLESPMIGICGNKIVRLPLMAAVESTQKVAEHIALRRFDDAMALRDTNFAEAYDQYLHTTVYDDGLKKLAPEHRLNIGVVHIGASSSGLNASTRAITLYCLSQGHSVFGIQNGFHGLITTGEMKPLTWLDVESWYNKGGSEIGTNRSLPSENYGQVAYHLQRHGLDGLIIIGGFEAFTSLHQLNQERKNYPIFNMPMIVIPATVSNNVPGTEYSLGCDTCLNQLVKYCDAVKQSASSTRRRVFITEVQGGHSGFVASFIGLVTGAIATYTPEQAITLKTIQEDVDLIFKVFENDRGEDKNGKMIIRNELSSKVYGTELLSDILKENGGKRFETRTAIPGHVQQGFKPTSMDRVMAVKFGIKAVKFIERASAGSGEARAMAGTRSGPNSSTSGPSFGTGPNSGTSGPNSSTAGPSFGPSFGTGPSTGPGTGLASASPGASSSHVIIGMTGSTLSYSPIADLYQEANIKLRKGTRIHWGHMIEVGDMLSGRLLMRKEQQ